MSHPCRGNCGKAYSAVFNRYKHEKVKGNWVENKANLLVEFDEETKLVSCST